MNDTKKTWVLISRITLLLVLDVVLILLSGLLALLSRYDFSLPALMEAGFARDLPICGFSIVAVSILIMIPMKLYNSLWAFAGVQELLQIPESQ